MYDNVHKLRNHNLTFMRALTVEYSRQQNSNRTSHGKKDVTH